MLEAQGGTSMTQGFWKRVGSMFGKNGDSVDVGTLTPTKERYTSRDGLQRLGTLLDSMQDHFDSQDRRAEALTQSVDKVASMLEQMNASQREQTEYMRELAAQNDTAAMNDALTRMPASLDSQSEAVRALAQQIEISQESDHRVSHSLRQLGSAVDRVRTASESQLDVFKQLQSREDTQHENLKDLLKEQSRRFLIIISVTAVLALGALGALVTALIMVMRSAG
jgi:chromosome segregation ATPase